MDHSYFKDRISSYHDKDLTDYDRQVVQEHLQTCTECQALLKDFERLDSLVEKSSQLGGDEYWEKSAQKIEQAITGETTTKVVSIKKSYQGLSWKIAATAASIAVIAFIGLYEGDIQQNVFDNEKQSPKIIKELETTTPAVEESDDLLQKDEVQFDSRSEETDKEPVDKIEEYGDVVEKRKADESDQPSVDVPSSVPQKTPPLPSAPIPSALSPSVQVVDADKAVKENAGSVSLPGEKNLNTSIEVMARESLSVSDEMIELSDILSVESEVVGIKKNAVANSSSLTIRGGRAGEVSYIVDGVPTIVLSESESKATQRMLRDKRDSLRIRIFAYGMVDRNKIGYSKLDDSLLTPIADSSYNVMLDSIITVVFKLGKLTTDSLELENQIIFLRDFPWNTTNNQYQKILENISELRSIQEK